MLFYSILQYLGSASYVARITLACKFINNRTLFGGRNTILLNGWKDFFGTVNNNWIYTKKSIGNGLFYLAFKTQRTDTDPG